MNLRHELVLVEISIVLVVLGCSSARKPLVPTPAPGLENTNFNPSTPTDGDEDDLNDISTPTPRPSPTNMPLPDFSFPGFDDPGSPIGAPPIGPAGYWLWDERAFPADIFPDGRIQAVDSIGPISATWQPVSNSNQIIVYWSTGFIDTLTLSQDGLSMTGFNNQGHWLTVRRRTVFPSEGRCALSAGEWLWDTRRFPATIFESGFVTGLDGIASIFANWFCIDPVDGEIVVRWNTGFTDYLTVSSDGRTLTGRNSINNQPGHPLLVIRR